MEPVRWGILSTARINRLLLAGARATDAVEVVAVASRDIVRALAYADRDAFDFDLDAPTSGFGFRRAAYAHGQAGTMARLHTVVQTVDRQPSASATGVLAGAR